MPFGDECWSLQRLPTGWNEGEEVYANLIQAPFSVPAQLSGRL